MATSKIPRNIEIKRAYASFTIPSGWSITELDSLTWYDNPTYTTPVTINPENIIAVGLNGGSRSYGKVIFTINSNALVAYADSSAAMERRIGIQYY